MFIFLQKFIENISSLFSVISFVLKNALVTTCYCANDENYYYKINTRFTTSENQYHIHFEAIAYNENYTPISTTEFTFSFSKLGLHAAFLGLSFREKMRVILNTFRNTEGKVPHNLNVILLQAILLVSGTLFITGKAMAQFFAEAKKHNREKLGIIDPEYEDKPFFYITFSKDDEIEVLEGIHVFKYLKRNWYSKSSEESQPSVDSQVEVSEPPILDSSCIENMCSKSTSDAAIADLGRSISGYIEPFLNRSIFRQLSNAEQEAINLYRETFDSPLNSPTERHTTHFNFMLHSVLEISNSFYANHWIIIGSILICLIVILLNLYVFLSFSNPELILKKEIIENYKNKLQNHELIQELNKMRKFLLKVCMVYSFINVIILGSFWYMFEKTLSGNL